MIIALGGLVLNSVVSTFARGSFRYIIISLNFVSATRARVESSPRVVVFFLSYSKSLYIILVYLLRIKLYFILY